MINLEYLHNLDAAKPFIDRNYFVTKKLGFRVIENGMILPHKSTPHWFGLGGIVDADGKYIPDSSVHYRTSGAYTPPQDQIQYSDETVIYFFMLFPVWGHCITDNIRRIWFLKSDIFKSEFKDCRLVYISWHTHNLETQKDFRRLLEILEVDVDKFQLITQPTKFKKIILPDDCFGSPHNTFTGFTNEYREMIYSVRDFALKNRTPTPYKKIYFFHGKKGQFGEERLAEYFKSKGYEIIRPETLTLDEELNLLINCDSFASCYGSTVHNSLFLRDNTEVIVIPRIASLLNAPYQEMVNQVRSLNVTYIDSTLSIFGRWSATGPWFFIVSEQLKRFFGDKFDGYDEEDQRTFLQYVKSCLSRNADILAWVRDRYKLFLADFLEQLHKREELIKEYDMPQDWEKKLCPLLTYQTHVHLRGWNDGWKTENEFSNPLDQMLDVLAIKINSPDYKVYYAVYFSDKKPRRLKWRGRLEYANRFTE